MPHIKFVLRRNLSFWLIGILVLLWTMPAGSDCEGQVYTVPAVELNATGDVIAHFEMVVERKQKYEPALVGDTLGQCRRGQWGGSGFKWHIQQYNYRFALCWFAGCDNAGSA